MGRVLSVSDFESTIQLIPRLDFDSQGNKKKKRKSDRPPQKYFNHNDYDTRNLKKERYLD